MWIRGENTWIDIAPSWIGALTAVFGLIVAVIGTGIAISTIGLGAYQILITVRQLRATAKREAQNSDDQTRPYIGIDLVPGLGGAPTFDLVIENFGKTTARGVRLRLVDNEFRAQSADDEIGPALGRLFAVGFDLAPGARRRVFWRLLERETVGAHGAPESADIAVEYMWQPDGNRDAHMYEDLLHYDLSEYPKLTPKPSGGKRTPDVGAEPHQKNILHVLEAIAEHVGELRR